MIQKSINLPLGKRLDLQVVKRRRNDKNPLINELGKVLRVKKGSKISRIFKVIFEQKNIKKILGTNMALLIMASSLVPTKAFGTEYEESVVSEKEITFQTEQTSSYPVKNPVITQGYTFFHPGFDFDGLTGDPIFSVKEGVVKAIEYSRFAYGNAILIDHGGGYTTLYAHLSKIYVTKGDSVETGDQIGEMGATGRAFGDHLHFEVRKNGIPVYPYSLLPQTR